MMNIRKTCPKIVRIAFLNKIYNQEIYDKYISTLTRALGFPYKLVIPEDGEYGRALSNGSWTGIIGLIQRNEADLSLNGLTLSQSRAEVVTFSYPFHRVSITFATRKSEYSPELTAFIKPFSLQVWLLILICITIMPLAFIVLFKKKCFQNFFWMMFKSFTGQAVSIKPKKTGDYIMMVCWLIATSILYYSYKAVLLSFLTFPPLEHIRTVPELAKVVKEGKYQCTAFSGSFLVKVFSNSIEPNLRIIGENLQKNNGSSILAAFNDTKTEKIPVFITADHILKPLGVKYFVSDDEMYPAFLAWQMQKNFCYKAQVNRLISKIWVSGLFKKFSSDNSFMTSLKILLYASDGIRNNKERQLSIDDFEGVFIMLVIGYLLSIITLIFEVLIFKIKAHLMFFKR